MKTETPSTEEVFTYLREYLEQMKRMEAIIVMRQDIGPDAKDALLKALTDVYRAHNRYVKADNAFLEDAQRCLDSRA